MDRPKYHIDIFWSDEDGGYIANVPDLSYCSAFGETYEEALREVLEAIELHLETLEELGRPIPEPSPHAGAPASEPAERFVDAIRESYRQSYLALADPGVSAQELNAQVTQSILNGVLDNLRSQAESNRALADDLIERQREHQETSQTLAQEGVDAYMDFLNSMFYYYSREFETGRKDRSTRR